MTGLAFTAEPLPPLHVTAWMKAHRIPRSNDACWTTVSVDTKVVAELSTHKESGFLLLPLLLLFFNRGGRLAVRHDQTRASDSYQ